MNDVILSWLAFDTLMDNDNSKRSNKKNSLTFTGICLLLVGIGFAFAVLYKLGIPAEQLQMAAVVMLAPFLWDYFINFSVMDLSNFQHILAAGGTILVAFLALILIEIIYTVIKRCEKSKFTYVQSFGFVLHMLTTAAKGLLLAVLVFAVFKGVGHSVLALLFWLF